MLRLEHLSLGTSMVHNNILVSMHNGFIFIFCVVGGLQMWSQVLGKYQHQLLHGFK